MTKSKWQSWLAFIVIHHAHFSVCSRVEQPVTWSAMTKLGGPDIKTSECVAYGQAQPPSTGRAEDTTYEVIEQ